MAHLLRQARPTALEAEDLTLAWPESAAFSKRQAEEPAKRELIAQAIRAVTGTSLRLAHELRADQEVGRGTAQRRRAGRPLQAEFDAEEEPPKEEKS